MFVRIYTVSKYDYPNSCCSCFDDCESCGRFLELSDLQTLVGRLQAGFSGRRLRYRPTSMPFRDSDLRCSAEDRSRVLTKLEVS